MENKKTVGIKASEMTTDNLLRHIMSSRKWYTPIGLTPQVGRNLKCLFNKGGLSDVQKENLLIRFGYIFEKNVIWCKKPSKKTEEI